MEKQPHDRVLEMLNESSVFVLPSITDPETGNKEGLPVTVLEASSHGLPVISTVHEGIPEAIEHNVTGLLAAEGDVDAIAGYMVTLAKGPELREEMGTRGRKKIISDGFTVEAMVEKLQSFIGIAARNYPGSVTKKEDTMVAYGVPKRVLLINHSLYPYENSGTPISTLNQR